MSKNIAIPQENESGDTLPLREGVGLMIINSSKQIFIGKRIGSVEGGGWQMPQGGIDEGEAPAVSALREMEEEIGTNLGQIVGESKCWYRYEIPRNLQDRCCGQKQKWFLIKFTGKDSDISVSTVHPEFEDWCWASAEEVLAKIIPFKYDVYFQVLKEFGEILKFPDSQT